MEIIENLRWQIKKAKFKLTDKRKVLDRLTKEEHKKLEDLRMYIQVFGTYDHMEWESTNKTCKDISKNYKKESSELKKKILKLHGFDYSTHCIWTDGVITKNPDNIDELRKESEKAEKENQARMENIQLGAMSGYGFKSSKGGND